MKKYESKAPLISIHIPKCGGTSLSNVLNDWFSPKLYFHYVHEKNKSLPKKHRIKQIITGKYRHNMCIHGHFNRKRSIGVNDYYPEANQMITFLRNPLEIVLSLYYYNLKLSKEGKNYRDGQIKEMTMNIDEFLETRNSYITYFFPVQLTKENFDSYINDHFVHIGVMEYYQTSLDILAEKLNKPKIQIPHENKSERKTQPSPLAVSRFKEKCELEYMIYNKALELNGIQ